MGNPDDKCITLFCATPWPQSDHSPISRDVRFENGEVVGKYTSGQLIKFYEGEFFYSVGLIAGENENEVYHLQLIRPKNYFYGEATDIFGNPLEEFVKMK